MMSGVKRKAGHSLEGGQFSGEEVTAEKRGIFLGGHCLFCLRKISPGGSEIPNKRPKATDLLPTWQWTWALVQRGCLDPRDMDTGEEEETQGSFRNVPPLCVGCTEQLASLDRLLNQVADQVRRLKRVVRESGKQYLNFRQSLRNSPNVTQEKMEKTLDFLAAFWSKFSIRKEDETEECDESSEDSNKHSDEETVPKSESDSSDGEDDPSVENDTGAAEAVAGDEKTVESANLEVKKECSSEDDDGKDGDPLSPSSHMSPAESASDSSSEEEEEPESGTECQEVMNAKNGKVRCIRCVKMITRSGYRLHLKNAHRIIVRGQLKWTHETKTPKPPKRKVKRSRQSSCEICLLKFPRSELEDHLAGHVGQEYLIRCLNPDCWFVSLTLSRLAQHVYRTKTCPAKVTTTMQKYRDGLNVCGVCGVKESNLVHLRRHLRSHETSTKNYPCPFSKCGMSFTLNQSLQLHLWLGDAEKHQLTTEVTRQPCDHCEGTTKKIPVQEMASHLKEHHGITTELLPCTHCSFQFSKREHLLRHLYVHRFETFFCDICGAEKAGSFKFHTNLLDHYYHEHGVGTPLTCDQCPKIFWRKLSLRLHTQQVHQAIKKKVKRVKCEDCEKSFKSQQNLREHAIREHGAPPLPCSYCSETFTSGKKLTAHQRQVHKGLVAREEFRCEEPNCGATFPMKHYLQSHHSVVHLGERHVCEVCGKSYTGKKALKDHHKIVHLGIKDQVCEVCGEAFVSSTNLKRHMLIHTMERPFACEICGQRFRQKEALTPHLKSHQKKGDDFKPTGPMKHIRKRVQHKRKQ